MEVGELAHARDREAPVRDVVRAPVPGGGDPAGHQFPGRGDPAGRLDLLEERPGRLGEVGGAALDVPGAAGGIEHPPQPRLLQQQRLRVAGDAPGEGVGQPEAGVERPHGDRLRPAHAGGEAGHGRAQQVDPRVARGHHGRAGDGVLPLAAGLRRAADLGDPGPQAAGRAQLGDGGELVGGGGVAEVDLAERLPGGQAAAGERPQLGDALRDRAGQLLGVAAARVVVGRGVHGDGPQPGEPVCAAPRQLDPGGAARGGDAQVAAGRDASRGGQLEQGLGGLRRQVTRLQDDRGEVEVDVLQHRGELAHRDRAGADDEPERGDAVLQVRQHGLGVGHGVPLAYVPAGGGRGTAYVGGRAGRSRVAGEVVRVVQRRDRDPVVRRPGQHLLRRAGLGPRLAQDLGRERAPVVP